MSLMSPRAVRTIQRTTERWMVDEIEIWRGSTSERDDETLIESPVEGTRIYAGKARVRPTRGPREHAVGDGVITMRDADFLLPINAPMPRRDDEVRVTRSDDPESVDTWFRITDVRTFSQQPARSFSAVQAQPSRLWPLGADDE